MIVISPGRRCTSTPLPNVWGWGGDVSLGFYLERPAYLSLAVVTCSPNRAKPELACPAARAAGTDQAPGRTRAAGGLSENSVGLRR